MKKSLRDKVIKYHNHIETVGDNNKRADQLWKTVFNEIDKMKPDEKDIYNIVDIVGSLRMNTMEVICKLDEYLDDTGH